MNSDHRRYLARIVGRDGCDDCEGDWVTNVKYKDRIASVWSNGVVTWYGQDEPFTEWHLKHFDKYLIKGVTDELKVIERTLDEARLTMKGVSKNV